MSWPASDGSQSFTPAQCVLSAIYARIAAQEQAQQMRLYSLPPVSGPCGHFLGSGRLLAKRPPPARSSAPPATSSASTAFHRRILSQADPNPAVASKAGPKAGPVPPAAPHRLSSLTKQMACAIVECWRHEVVSFTGLR